jgi:hypothetical protein
MSDWKNTHGTGARVSLDAGMSSLNIVCTNWHIVRNVLRFVRFEVFTAATMKNVFWYIKPKFVPHRRHITSPLERTSSWCYISFQVFTVVTEKDIIYWDIKTQFIPRGKHITSQLQCPADYSYIIFEVFTAVTMKNIVFWDTKLQFIPHTLRLHYREQPVNAV